ncbi:MAG: hypothetical protein A2033_17615 [Bacteroidetes bacterium GWA2_31_9]|nr:MAG: hypothetical protein A2033_17615 [Bacteroidetes bacterium GWA2_31_9]
MWVWGCRKEVWGLVPVYTIFFTVSASSGCLVAFIGCLVATSGCFVAFGSWLFAENLSFIYVKLTNLLLSYFLLI